MEVLKRKIITITSLQTSTDTFENRVDLDETVSSGSTLLLILLLIFDWNPFLQQWLCPNSEMEESISETQG